MSCSEETLREVKQIVDFIKFYLGKDLLVMKAIELGFTKKAGKLDAHDFLLINLYGMSKNGQECSLTDLCTQAAKLGIKIKRQSLNERFNDYAVLVYKWLFQQVLETRLLEHCSMEMLGEFVGVHVEDATLFQLPGCLVDLFKGFGGDSSSSAIKINCRLDLQSNLFSLRVKDGTANDSKGFTFGVAPGSLWLRDLGYYKTDELMNLANQGAYFVSRIQMDRAIYFDTGGNGKIDLLELCGQLKPQQAYEHKVYIGNKQRFGCRMIVIKLPRAEADRKRQKMIKTAKAKGKKVSQRRLKLCDINVFITNLPAQKWPPMKIWQLYTVRWQIEILFKAWKSVLNLNKIKPVKAHRVLCQLYIKMTEVTVITKLFRYFKVNIWNTEGKEISELNGFKIINTWWIDLLHAIEGPAQKLLTILLDLGENLGYNGEKRKVKHKHKARQKPIFCYIC